MYCIKNGRITGVEHTSPSTFFKRNIAIAVFGHSQTAPCPYPIPPVDCYCIDSIINGALLVVEGDRRDGTAVTAAAAAITRQ